MRPLEPLRSPTDRVEISRSAHEASSRTSFATGMRSLAGTMVAFLLVATSPASPALADNVVPNAEFDVNLQGWNTPAIAVDAVWDPRDVDDSGASGSALVTSAETRLRTAVGLSQCVPLPAVDLLEFSGAVYVPSGQSEEAVVGYVMDWQEGDCNGRISLGLVPNAEGTDAWEILEETFEPPIGAGSVNILGFINFAAKNDPDGAFQAHFDSIRLVPEPSTALLHASALLVLAALAVGRRSTGRASVVRTCWSRSLPRWAASRASLSGTPSSDRRHRIAG